MHGVTLDEVFPHRVCINLDRRADRWQRMQARFAAHGIASVERVAAVDGRETALPAGWRHTAGAYGCLRSHLAVVEEARRRGLPSVLVFEDDVVFHAELETRLARCVETLPPDWDMLFLGALHKDEPVPVSDCLARLTRSNSTYAYAIRDTAYEAFIELNRRAANVLDENTIELQQRFQVYGCMPHLAWVEHDWSDAQAKIEGHWYLEQSLVLFGAGADRLLADTAVVLAHDGGDPANVRYLARYYDEFFAPHVKIVVVEPDDGAGVRDLPSNCRRVVVPAPFERERAFAAGLAEAGDRRFAVLSDANLWLETLDFRANLRMCERYAAATGFSTMIELTAAESDRLRRTSSTRGLTAARPSRPGPHRGHCRFVNRSLQATPPFQLFDSPNHALRLQ